ncbi:MAG: hypothetical protein ACOYJ1_09665 [Peptococcales bacterium]
MNIWDILIYFSVGVCFVGAGAVCYGFFKHLSVESKKKTTI